MLVDVENFLGRRYVTASGARWARNHLHSLLGLREDELVVGTSHPENLLAAGSGWRGARHLCRPGADGADLALIDVLDENIEARFTEVVIISGDAIFAAPLARLAARHIKTTVVARADSLSSRLRLAAQQVLCPNVQFFGPVLEGMAA